MKQFLKQAGIVLVAILIGIFGLLLGRYVLPDNGKAEEKVTSSSIVSEIATQGFLVTQTVVSEEKVQYKVDNGSDWSNFWWGHEVTSRATMSSTYGVDLTKISDKDVVIDNARKSVCFMYPANEVKSVSLIGDIEVSTKSGILKYLFANDTNKDYNLALDLLQKQAKNDIATMVSLPKDSYAQADKTLSLLFLKSGYAISADCRR